MLSNYFAGDLRRRDPLIYEDIETIMQQSWVKGRVSRAVTREANTSPTATVGEVWPL